MEAVIPDFAHAQIAKVEVEHMLRFWTDSGWQFNLEGDVTLRSGDRTVRIGDVSTSAQSLSDELVGLKGATIEAVSVSDAGDLTIRSAVAQIDVSADDGFEAWQIYGPSGEIIVCMPGGELAIWGPRVT